MDAISQKVPPKKFSNFGGKETLEARIAEDEDFAEVTGMLARVWNKVFKPKQWTKDIFSEHVVHPEMIMWDDFLLFIIC